MASYFDEKGLSNPQKSTRGSENCNPDLAHFFEASPSSGSAEGPDMEQFLAVASLFGSFRDHPREGDDEAHRQMLDNLISQLLEEANATSRGPPPASATFIRDLPVIGRSEFKAEDACIVCAESFRVEAKPGDQGVTKLPCGHLFDRECIVPWLQLHNTCPNCRHEVDSDDPKWREKQAEARRVEDSEEEDPDWMYG